MSEAAMKRSPETQLEPPRFEDGKAFILAGLSEHFSPENRKNLPGLWQCFAPHIGNITGQVGRVAYGLCFNADSPEGMDYMAAVEVSNTAGLPPEFAIASIPAQKYAVFSHHGHVSKLYETLSAIDKWLPGSGLQVSRENSELPCFFERYSEEFNPQTGMGGMEVWLPIKA
jgi:AraC family transcriptional regulator